MTHREQVVTLYRQSMTQTAISKALGISKARVGQLLAEEGAVRRCKECGGQLNTGADECYKCRTSARCKSCGARALKGRMFCAEHWHGRVAGYRSGCHCALCTNANREYHAARVAARRVSM